MNFTKLVLGDALGDMDLAGLSLLGFEEQVEYSDKEQYDQDENSSSDSEFKLPVQFQIKNADADLTEHVYKMSDLFMPQASEHRHKAVLTDYLNTITNGCQSLKDQET